jgi:hypothetical protein
MPWSSTSGLAGMLIGAERGMSVDVGGVGEDHGVPMCTDLRVVGVVESECEADG